MARGWESKDVESQMEDIEERKASRSAPAMPTQERELRNQIESTELSRTRVVQDLKSAMNANYKQMLQRSLDYLDAKIAELKAQLSKLSSRE